MVCVSVLHTIVKVNRVMVKHVTPIKIYMYIKNCNTWNFNLKVVHHFAEKCFCIWYSKQSLKSEFNSRIKFSLSSFVQRHLELILLPRNNKNSITWGLLTLSFLLKKIQTFANSIGLVRQLVMSGATRTFSVCHFC